MTNLTIQKNRKEKARKFPALRPTTIKNIMALVERFQDPSTKFTSKEINRIGKYDTILTARRIGLLREVDNSQKKSWKLTSRGKLLLENISNAQFSRKIIFMQMYKNLLPFRKMLELGSESSFNREKLESIGIDKYDSSILVKSWGRELGIIEKTDQGYKLTINEISNLFGVLYITQEILIKTILKIYVLLIEKTKISYVPYPEMRERICEYLLISEKNKYDIDDIVDDLAREYLYVFRFAAGDQEKTGVGLKYDRQKIHIAIDTKTLEEEYAKKYSKKT